MRLRLLKRKAADRIDKMFGKMGDGIAFHIQNCKRALSGSERTGHGFPDAAVVTCFRLKAVNHQFYKVRFVAVKRINCL